MREMGSSQGCLAGWSETMIIHWNKWGSDWTYEVTCSPWGQARSGAGCPERLRRLCHWRFPSPDFLKPWVTRVDLRADPFLRPPRSLPTRVMLRSYDYFNTCCWQYISHRWDQPDPNPSISPPLPKKISYPLAKGTWCCVTCCKVGCRF